MSKKDKERDDHSGSTAAEDSELTLWLNRLWARNEPPERVELWQMFGRNKVVRGETIHHEDFKPNEKMNIEQVNKLANEIMEAAQHDCNVARRERWYQLVVIDRNRKAQPLTRGIGPLQPKRSHAIATLNDIDGEEDEPQDAKSIEITYIKEGLDQARWDKQRYDTVMGEMLMLQGGMIRELREQNERLFSQHMMFFEKMQEAEDRSLQRQILLEKEKFKVELARDAKRTVRNLLPGIFGGEPSNGAMVQSSNGNGNGNGNGHAAEKAYGSSPERTLVDNLMHDFEEAGLDSVLFGEAQEVEGKLVQTTPGIFSIKQLRILLGVQSGKLPVETLDELVPGSPYETAITQDQVIKSGEAGVTEGMGLALQEILVMRQRARLAREAATQKNTDDNKNPTPSA